MKRNIVLPIAPEFVQKILCGEKKYEYRKIMCKREIKKIYFYATAPLKSIVGEAEVVEKVVMNKAELWERTKDNSGITYEHFCEYFKGKDTASAYALGRVKKYDTPIKLEEINIFYVPQSYVYIEDLTQL